MAIRKKNNKDKKHERRKINFRYNLSVYFNLLKKYKFTFIGILILILLVEGFRVLDKYLFKVVIDSGTEFSAGSILADKFVQILLIVAGVFISVWLLKIIFGFIYEKLMHNLEADMMADVKRNFFNHIIGLSHNFHTTHRTGSLISKLNRGGRAVERMTDIIVYNFTPLIFQMIIISASLIYLSWVPAVIIFLTVILFISYSFIMQRIQQDSNLRFVDAEDAEKGTIADFLTNIDSIKYFGKEANVKRKFYKVSEETKTKLLKYWGYWKYIGIGRSIILNAGTFFLVLFPILQVLKGEMTIGTVAFIYTVYMSLIGYLFSFVHGLRDYYRVMADFEALFPYGKIQNEIKDKPNAKSLKIRRGSIDFDNLDFRYGKRRIFSKFNLDIKPNEKVALVGHSGCGKSTLVKLLYRLHDVERGGIMIDGKDIREFRQESLRGEMSIVPQEAVLFDDTIYNNIAFSKPGASREEVMRAIKFAQLDKIIKDFPDKEKTIVGERGVKLSGGEKQRVSIARAILADKKILVLDEATSALDSETEHEIQKDLEKLMKGRTSIMIAHRLSTIMKADKIVVMQRGKIVQMGTHRQLIAKPGEYKKLWNLQKGGYIK